MKSTIRDKGFTLIEMVSVSLMVVVLGVLAVAKYQKTLTQTRQDQAMVVARDVANAIALYQVRRNTLPNSDSVGTYCGDPDSPCTNLIDKHLLANQDWNSSQWVYHVCASGDTQNPCVNASGTDPVLAIARLRNSSRNDLAWQIRRSGEVSSTRWSNLTRGRGNCRPGRNCEGT